MITNFFIPELNNHDVQELWFQQDCATCDTARATIDFLKDTFGDRLISRFGPPISICLSRNTMSLENLSSATTYFYGGSLEFSAIPMPSARGKKKCALWAGGITGPYFFKNDEGHNVTVNGDRYRAMIANLFIPELNNHDVQELWFQQDGATCHTARATIDLLKDTFGDRLISRFEPVNWPPRSCDLTPLDYVLWGYVKSLVYADKPQTLDHLEDNIRRVIADMDVQIGLHPSQPWHSYARNHI
ncbi:uncharacterized protein TNCV_3591541 [Trichonephila clavipes]|nr:uncharacterized protein TNCV_3591541 [Trichonephila clavipes]